MGTPTGPEDASAGASTPPRGISPAATAEGRRLVAGLVVVMLVLASTAILLDRLSPPVEDPDDDGPDIPPEPGSTVMITGTTVWESIEGPYEVYAEVLRGGSLTLRGCDITVAYEDLVYRDAPLFDVMTDASLVLEDTTIRVTLDPNSTRAVYSRPPAYGHMGQDPILSRVVNLLHARTPVLSMNVRWKAPRTDLVVVGQRSPTDDFLLLARLGALGGGGWERLTVDLGPLAGAVARVAVFPLDDGYDALYISDARVLDGGVVPEGDRFDTGIAEEDGWDTGYFRSLVRLGPDGHEPHMGPLINCWSKGTLVMENATLEAPAGLPRWTDHEEGTFLSWLDGQRMMRQMYSHSTIGLHVHCWT